MFEGSILQKNWMAARGSQEIRIKRCWGAPDCLPIPMYRLRFTWTSFRV